MTGTAHHALGMRRCCCTARPTLAAQAASSQSTPCSTASGASSPRTRVRVRTTRARPSIRPRAATSTRRTPTPPAPAPCARPGRAPRARAAAPAQCTAPVRRHAVGPERPALDAAAHVAGRDGPRIRIDRHHDEIKPNSAAAHVSASHREHRPDPIVATVTRSTSAFPQPGALPPRARHAPPPLGDGQRRHFPRPRPAERAVARPVSNRDMGPRPSLHRACLDPSPRSLSALVSPAVLCACSWPRGALMPAPARRLAHERSGPYIAASAHRLGNGVAPGRAATSAWSRPSTNGRRTAQLSAH
jgi:hypothetical protein